MFRCLLATIRSITAYLFGEPRPHSVRWCGSQVITTDTCTINGKLDRDWRIITEHGIPLYIVLPCTNLRDAQRLDDRLWPRDHHGNPTAHRMLTIDITPPAGMQVIWKGSIADHEWCDGVIKYDGANRYVESSTGVWGMIEYDDDNGYWIVTGVSMPVGNLEFTP